MNRHKKRAAKSDSLLSKSRNNHSEEVVAEKSFVVMMSVHCAGFYADSGVCQDVEKGRVTEPGSGWVSIRTVVALLNHRRSGFSIL